MTDITIHGLEDPIDSLLRERARQQGISLNKAIKQILAESFGLTLDTKKNRHDFEDLSGAWTSEDVAEFSRAAQDFSIVEPRDWE